MKRLIETLDLTWETDTSESDGEPVPGLVMIVMGGESTSGVLPIAGRPIQIGRETEIGDHTLLDGTVSRRHAQVAWANQNWHIQDLGSRNGSAVDAIPLNGEIFSANPTVLRLGNTLFLLIQDIRPYQSCAIMEGEDGIVMGPPLAESWQAISRAARYGRTLHIQGESGVGKELAAQAFHQFYDEGPLGPFVPVNCAAIPEGVAERLLFGTVKGAFSGADTDAEGYIQAADGGTLFLDEVAELDLAVQAKLLRVLESNQVMALGAARPRTVNLRICSATHKDLRAQVAAGKLREDLYFRLSQPTVQLPPLRERLCEIPRLIENAVRMISPDLKPHVSLIEACIMRHWPGNVRELIAEIRTASQEAIASDSPEVELRHLRAAAGVPFSADPTPSPIPAQAKRTNRPEPEEIEAALSASQGNVSRAARMLGLHRTQLRRWIDRFGIDPKNFG